MALFAFARAALSSCLAFSDRILYDSSNLLASKIEPSRASLSFLENASPLLLPKTQNGFSRTSSVPGREIHLPGFSDGDEIILASSLLFPFPQIKQGGEIEYELSHPIISFN